MKKNSAQEIADSLMRINMSEIEVHFLKWLSHLFTDYEVHNLLEVADNSVVWIKIAEIARMKTIAFEADFFNKKTIENYVKMLDEIWQQKNINIFEIFSNNLKEDFSEDFVFEKDFIDFIYSHTN